MKTSPKGSTLLYERILPTQFSSFTFYHLKCYLKHGTSLLKKTFMERFKWLCCPLYESNKNEFSIFHCKNADINIFMKKAFVFLINFLKIFLRVVLFEQRLHVF